MGMGSSAMSTHRVCPASCRCNSELRHLDGLVFWCPENKEHVLACLSCRIEVLCTVFLLTGFCCHDHHHYYRNFAAVGGCKTRSSFCFCMLSSAPQAPSAIAVLLFAADLVWHGAVRDRHVSLRPPGDECCSSALEVDYEHIRKLVADELQRHEKDLKEELVRQEARNRWWEVFWTSVGVGSHSLCSLFRWCWRLGQWCTAAAKRHGAGRAPRSRRRGGRSDSGSSSSAEWEIQAARSRAAALPG